MTPFTVPSLKMELPLMTTREVVGPTMEIRRLPIIGAQSGKFFEYPSTKTENDKLVCSKDFKQRVLTKIQTCVGVGIYSLAFTYSDGFDTPCIGARSSYNHEIKLMDHEKVKQVSIRAFKENYVQQLIVKATEGEKSIKSAQINGNLVDFKMKDGERIIGVHGYMDSNDDVRGFGFLVAPS
jgi:hypothetical protein